MQPTTQQQITKFFWALIFLFLTACGNTINTVEPSDNSSSDNSSGNDGSGNDGSGNDGSGNDGSGNDGSGNDDSGNDDSGNDDSGNDDSGNDDSGNSVPLADLSVFDTSATEGDTGKTNLVFTLTLKDYKDNASVKYTTSTASDNTATADDYDAQTGTVNFSSGTDSKTIIIKIKGDTTVEPDETFTLTLSKPVNLKLSTTTVTGTIINDDFRLNDTGITWAGENPTGNKTGNDCTSNINGIQDCNYGRDKTHNDKVNGVAGFSFTKLDATGKVLTNQAANGHACVRDNITGLIWEVKTTSDTGPRSMYKKYRWGGLTAIGKDHISSKKGNYNNDWNVLLEKVNSDALCGFSNWRVPSMEELHSIIHLGKDYPAIDQNYFSNTQYAPDASQDEDSSWYWSSSPSASSYRNGEYAWALNFNIGYGGNSDRENYHYVRLVRSRK